jgi:hypothetical protein
MRKIFTFFKQRIFSLFRYFEWFLQSTIASFLSTHKLAREFLSFGAISFCLFLSYCPALYFHYIHHDDMLFFLSDWAYKIYGCFIFNFFSGRFIGAFILEYAMMLVNTVFGLTLIRYFTFAIFCVCAFAMVRWYRRYLLSLGESLFFVLTVFTLPYFEIVVSYAGIFFHSIGVLFSIGAGFFAYQVSRTKSFAQALRHPYFFLSIFLFICALSIYQSVAVFYWALLGPIILFTKKEDELLLKKQILVYYVAGIVSLFLYAGILQIVKEGLTFYSQYVYNPYDISLAFWVKLTWFFQEPLMNSLNLWNVYPSIFLGLGVLFFILASLLFFGIRHVQKMKEKGASNGIIFKPLAWRFGAFIPLFFLSFLPNLLWSGNAPFYRCCLGPSFLIMSLLFWSFKQWTTLLSFRKKEMLVQGTLIFILGFGIFSSYQNIYRWIGYPNYLELEFIKDHLAQKQPFEYNQIYLIHPGQGLLRERYDEFGFQTSNAAMDKVGLLVGALRDVVSKEYQMTGMEFDPGKEEVSCFFGENGKEALFRIRMRIEMKTPDQIASIQEPGLMIDTTRLYEPGAPLHYLRKDSESDR